MNTLHLGCTRDNGFNRICGERRKLAIKIKSIIFRSHKIYLDPSSSHHTGTSFYKYNKRAKINRSSEQTLNMTMRKKDYSAKEQHLARPKLRPQKTHGIHSCDVTMTSRDVIMFSQGLFIRKFSYISYFRNQNWFFSY